MQEVQATLPIGTMIQGRYSVEGLLGRGGFGAVYLVRDQRVTQNLYALKEVVDPNRRERKRFIFEAELLERLDHPALPRVYRVFENEQHERAFMLMDYVDGPNLEVLRRRQSGKRFALSQVLTIMRPIMNAVGYLHIQNPPIIHRDIKPSNIIAPSSGAEAVLVDFGIAKVYDPETTTTAVHHCTPGYGAPEQYGTGTNTRTDIYGLGATIYTLLTGIVPIDAFFRVTQMGGKGIDPLEPLDKLVPTLPRHIVNAIRRAMALDVEDRFPTVEDFWQALNAEPIPPPLPSIESVALAASQPTVVTKPFDDATTVKVGQNPQSSRRRKVGAVLLALLALLIALASAVGLWYAVTHPGRQLVATPTPGLHRTTVSTPAHKATVRPSPSPHPTTVPTASVATVPTLAHSYAGFIHNTPANINSTMSLTSVQQNGGQISGNFAVGSGLQGSGPFNGTVSNHGSISFLVQAFANLLPLYFYGTINSDRSLSGNYCSYHNGQCNYLAGGYGTWRVTPQSSSSATPGPGSFVPIDTPQPVS